MQREPWAWWSSKSYSRDKNTSRLSYKTSSRAGELLICEIPGDRSIVAASVGGKTMKVLLCLCAWIAAATAHGVISYPVAPLGYHSTYLSPVLTNPFGVSYTGLHGYPVPLVPNYIFYPGGPGFVQYLPLAPPTGGKGKPDEKKPGSKDDKDKKEETTEEPKKEEESKTDETEDLAQ